MQTGGRRVAYAPRMADVVIASDAAWVREEIAQVLSQGSHRIREVDSGPAVLAACKDRAPDLVVLDFQIGQMGGVATCLDVRLEEGAGRLPRVGCLLLLDRRADVFLSRRASADGWLVKPLDPIRIRKAVAAIVSGGSYFDDTGRPESVAAG